MNSTIKNIITFLAIFLVIGLGYWFFSSRGNSTDITNVGLSGSVQSTNPVSSGSGLPSEAQVASDVELTAGTDFLSALLNLNNIKLEDSVLSSPVLSSLFDFSVELESEGDAGRSNPFAPLGSDVSIAPNPTPSPAPVTPRGTN